MSSVVVDDLTFELRRSARRTLGITVDRDGSLLLRLPEDCPVDEGRAFAQEKRYWIYKKLARKKLLRRPNGPKRYVPGEGFYYLGRSYRLKLIDAAGGDVPPLRLYRGRFLLHEDEHARAEDHFREWYVRHGQAYISRRVERYQHRLETVPAAIRVQSLGYRWGSCGPARRLNFHWRTVLLPRRLIDYVVVHELAHLHEPRHDRAFWRRVERVMPDYEARKQWLAEEGGCYY